MSSPSAATGGSAPETPIDEDSASLTEVDGGFEIRPILDVFSHDYRERY